MDFFPNLEPICCSMSSSNCCFLTCIQVSQEAGKVVWYSHLLGIFQFVVMYTVKGFSIVNEAEVDVFQKFLRFFVWSNGCWQFPLWFLCFSKSSLNIWKVLVHILLKPTWRILIITLLAFEMRAIMWWFEHSFPTRRSSDLNICWIIEKAREFQKNIYFCFIDYAKAFDCVAHNKL